jgi:uncharacterized DUF497 family protein
VAAIDIFGSKGFEWDDHNIRKKHQVTPGECEEVFFNLPLLVQDDQGHSIKEKRLFALGQTNADRELFVAFTLRGDLIRVISARDMHRAERKVYRSL